MEFLNNLLPVLISGLMALIGYLIKMLLDLSHRVLALEVKIEDLLRQLTNDKRNIKE
jgi:hypothetical protein